MASFRDSDLPPNPDRLIQAAQRQRQACAENLVALPGPFYALADLELQLGNTKEALVALLRGLDINPYVARFLLYPQDLPIGDSSPPSGTPEEAAAYLARAESWSVGGLSVLERVLLDPEVDQALERVHQEQAELREMPTSAQRYDRLEALLAERRQLFGEEAAHALHERLFSEKAPS